MSVLPKPQHVNDQSSPPLRRRFRFRIVHVAIFVALLACIFGWLTSIGEKQRAAVEEIRERGGKVGYESVPTTSSESNPAIYNWMVKHLGVDFFYSVVEIDLADSDYNSNVWTEHLEALNAIHTLSIKGKQVDNDVLKSISKLNSLVKLKISGLESLDDWGYETIVYTGIANSGLQHLTRMELESLTILVCDLNDESLEIIGEIGTLREAFLTGTFSSEAMLEFRANRLEPSRFNATNLD